MRIQYISDAAGGGKEADSEHETAKPAEKLVFPDSDGSQGRQRNCAGGLVGPTPIPIPPDSFGQDGGGDGDCIKRLRLATRL